MSDQMRVQPFSVLLTWILNEYREHRSIFGIPETLFFQPRAGAGYSQELFGHHLAVPLGPAAGPHTQLAQNIVSAWLTGGRFIELKTVQIMDELEIPRPCIDMADEGYNVEWSQELKLNESVKEYINAWGLIHVLRRVLGFDGSVPFGTIFNMSVGYDLKGIQSPAMTAFMAVLGNASADVKRMQEEIAAVCPEFADVVIPAQVTDNVTLSTMHGCPPDEIERIARYLIEDRRLHTTVKLNPTLLGKATVLKILHDDLGFREIDIPDSVFEKDIHYETAMDLVRSLRRSAEGAGVQFAVKLSNTLAMSNHRGVLPGDEMYMSGRALYPLTMTLLSKLNEEFSGDLNISYSAGADALNVADIISSGARTVTVASDLLKPGGYGRMQQYIETIDAAMTEKRMNSLPGMMGGRIFTSRKMAKKAREDKRYHKSYSSDGLPKIMDSLEIFDCIAAPCVDQCAVHQNVPEYAGWIARGDYNRALESILVKNPLPGITGHVCTHLCQTKCTRNNYDEPVNIRVLKRFALEKGNVEIASKESCGKKVAVIGGGPGGLAAAYYLTLNGIAVTVYEAGSRAGGMPVIAPEFRMPKTIVEADVKRITDMGVKILLNTPWNEPPEKLLSEGYDAVFTAIGFPNDIHIDLPGIDAQGVMKSLEFLHAARQGQVSDLGRQILVVGGGNTAMDVARTAQRLAGQPVTVVYRRSQAEMPAEAEEIHDLILEGNAILELMSPVGIVTEGGKVTGLKVIRNTLTDPGPDGRRKPVPVPGSESVLPADTIILAIGQEADRDIFTHSRIQLKPNGRISAEAATGETQVENVFAGGDAVRGPAIIIQACADGRKAAEAICSRLNLSFYCPSIPVFDLTDMDIPLVKKIRARKIAPVHPDMLDPDRRMRFELIEQTLDEAAAKAEAGRCLLCSQLCDKCVEVCPNRANYSMQVPTGTWQVPVLACQDNALTQIGEEMFEIRQSRQIIHLDDLCNECGNCATFCVHDGKPYTDKPRLFFREADFVKEESNAYHIDQDTIQCRWKNQTLSLTMQDGSVRFETADFQVVFSNDFSIKTLVLKQAFKGEFSLLTAAQMMTILQGFRTSNQFISTAATLLTRE